MPLPRRYSELGEVVCAHLQATVAFQHLRPFIAIDACHIMSRYRLTLMIATMMDGNGQIVPMCWALVPKENYSHWIWFLKHMKEAFNSEYFKIDQL